MSDIDKQALDVLVDFCEDEAIQMTARDELAQLRKENERMKLELSYYRSGTAEKLETNMPEKDRIEIRKILEEK